MFELDGKPAGLFVEVLEYCAGELGWRLEYVRDDWSSLLSRLESGDIDLLPAVGYTDERLARFDFTARSLYIDSGVVFTGRKFTPHTVFDLDGRRVAAVEGSIFTAGFEAYAASFGIECRIVPARDNPAVMAAIASGEVDAGVCIYSLGNELAKRYPVEITAISFSPVSLHFAAPKGRNADLIAGIDRLMEGMSGDPQSAYNVAFRKWAIPREEASIPRWMKLGLYALLAAGLFLAALTFALRREVARKTVPLRAEVEAHRAAEAGLTRSLAEKNTLLHELFHRTKNTLQLVQSMVELQAADYPDDPVGRKISGNTADRIQAISLVHNLLYSARDLSRISARDYLRELAGRIQVEFGSVSDRVSVETEAPDTALSIDTIIPLGLAVNELLVNSLKHAFPGGRSGSVSIRLERRDDASFTLDYADDGVGMPTDADGRATGGFGLQLVGILGEGQLGGSVDISWEGGMRCSIRFKPGNAEERSDDLSDPGI